LSNWKIDLITIDELSLLAEEDIADRISKCRSEMGKRMGDAEWRQRWETELAYAQRELQIRHTRRRHHQEYVEREHLEELSLSSEEDVLPEYDGNRIPRYVREMFEWN
jgi:hypothetical protein